MIRAQTTERFWMAADSSQLKDLLLSIAGTVQALEEHFHLLRFHVPFWLSHILVSLFYLRPSLCPS